MQTNPVGEWSGIVIISNQDGTFSPSFAGLGIHTITYTTFNGSCVNEATIDILVEDITPPDFTFCPLDVQTNTVSCSAFVNISNPTATDNCPGAITLSFVAEHNVYGTITSGTITNFNQASNIYPAGVTTITWTATDLAGNTSTCQTVITVNDSANPVIFCQQSLNLVGYTSPGLCGAQIDLATPVAYDNCGLDQIGFVANHTTDANGVLIDIDPNTPGNQPEVVFSAQMPRLLLTEVQILQTLQAEYIRVVLQPLHGRYLI